MESEKRLLTMHGYQQFSIEQANLYGVEVYWALTCLYGGAVWGNHAHSSAVSRSDTAET